MKTAKEIIDLISDIKSNGEYTLSFGEYDVYADCTRKRFYYQSNNDSGEREIAFLLCDKENVTLDFGGSALVFHGRITPFVIENCKNVTLKNVIVDYDRPFYTEGVIAETGEDYFVLKINAEKFPYRVKNGSFIAVAPFWENDLADGINLFLEFDAEKRAPAYNSVLQIAVTGKNAKKNENAPIAQTTYLVEDMGEGYVKFVGSPPRGLKSGNVMTITHEKRMNSIIYASESENLRFENIEVTHGGAMGIVCQLCENVSVSGFRCELTERSKGLITLNCDALHFVNCSGVIDVENCVMYNMMDDAINVHGIYNVVSEVGEGRLTLDIRHFQQFGINVYKKGDVAFVAKKGTWDEFIPVSVNRAELINERQIEILTDSDLSNVVVGSEICNDSRMPEVRVCGCRTGNNRPRGFLVTTPKEITIENNYFANSAYALHFSGDTAFWYESGGVRNLKITGNRFDNCCYHFGEYPVLFSPVAKDKRTGYYHKNVLISGNRFDVFGDGLVFAEHVENITVKDNLVVKSSKYEKRTKTAECSFTECRNATFLPFAGNLGEKYAEGNYLSVMTEGVK